MAMIICGKYGNNRSWTENFTEQTWFSKSRSNDLEDIGQGPRSSHVTHLLMLVIICTKYGNNPSRTEKVIICDKYGNNRSRTENFTEQTQFSKSRSNDLEDIGQGQRSSHATHLLMLVIICTKYGNNRSRTEKIRADIIFKIKVEWPWRYRSRSKVITCNTPSYTSDYLC